MYSRGGNKSFTVFLRVFKVLRIVKLVTKVKGAQAMLALVYATLESSIDALGVLGLFIVMALLFFGSIIFVLESGSFQVTSEYPNGEYLRATISGEGLEVSPYVSIPTSMYWVMTTCTTGRNACVYLSGCVIQGQ